MSCSLWGHKESDMTEWLSIGQDSIHTYNIYIYIYIYIYIKTYSYTPINIYSQATIEYECFSQITFINF